MTGDQVTKSHQGSDRPRPPREEAEKLPTKVGGTERLVLAGEVGLPVMTLLGRTGLSAAESTGHVEGSALPFSPIWASGFGLGPQTAQGLTPRMQVLPAGAACWFAILVAVFERPMCHRLATGVPGNGLPRFEIEPSSSKLFGLRQEDRG